VVHSVPVVSNLRRSGSSAITLRGRLHPPHLALVIDVDTVRTSVITCSKFEERRRGQVGTASSSNLTLSLMMRRRESTTHAAFRQQQGRLYTRAPRSVMSRALRRNPQEVWSSSSRSTHQQGPLQQQRQRGTSAGAAPETVFRRIRHLVTLAASLRRRRIIRQNLQQRLYGALRLPAFVSVRRRSGRSS
jgi:hypothetical protein